MKIYCVIHGHYDSGYFGPSELCDSREWFATLDEAKDSYLNGKHKADWKAILALDLGALQESQVVLEKPLRGKEEQ